MPVPEDAKGPMTMRQAVVSYECGTGGRRAVAKARKKKGPGPAEAVSEKAGKQQKVQAKKAKSAQKGATVGSQ